MKPFIFTHIKPGFLPPVMLDSEEVLCGPRFTNLKQNGQHRYIHTPHGFFDADEVFGNIQSKNHPKLILVHADSSLGCLPSNLPQNCMKVLLVGDTHHLTNPIQNLLYYASNEHFDAIVMWNRQHAHFFTELGFDNVYWMPGLIFAVPTRPLSETRNNKICFFGQLGDHHPRRVRILQELTRRGMEVLGGHMTRKDSLKLISGNLASLNISLNGEFNMRIFESTQAGALLFNEKPCSFIGIDRFYKQNESIVFYESVDELIELWKYYTDDLQKSSLIAQEGRRITNRFFSFETRRRSFFDLINHGNFPGYLSLSDEPRCKIKSTTEQNKNATIRRIQVYEIVQEIHRKTTDPKVIITSGVTPFIAIDLADLARLKQFLIADECSYSQKIQPLLNQMDVKNAKRIDPHSLDMKSCDLLITTSAEVLQLNRQRARCDIWIWDYGRLDRPAIQFLKNEGYASAGELLPGLFRFTGRIASNPTASTVDNNSTHPVVCDHV